MPQTSRGAAAAAARARPRPPAPAPHDAGDTELSFSIQSEYSLLAGASSTELMSVIIWVGRLGGEPSERVAEGRRPRWSRFALAN